MKYILLVSVNRFEIVLNYGISQINEAVSHIDGITQENANLAATNSESSNLLKMQSKHLNHLIERFKYD